MSLALASPRGSKPVQVRPRKAQSPGTLDEHFGTNRLLLEGFLDLSLSLAFFFLIFIYLFRLHQVLVAAHRIFSAAYGS